ncbi:phage BR0599 family protein [Horticoccus luteus]|uniref:Phage BR0599 family protein n=1 Tax=Horticoccus luteus TaxID=2862869 RepID=A0A8F9TWC5_9BACT|nr:phage BR0599 family protein [Horticoccus luteus]QYM80295.1 phage BR0599 family protein [Horticoccus luteus]
MSFALCTFGGRDFALLLFTPQVAEDGSLAVTYAFSTQVDMGESGRETREPGHPDLRLKQSCEYLLPTSADAAALRARLATLGDTLVAVPLWIDRLAGAAWADRVHTAPLLVRFSDGAIVDGASELDPDQEYAPLLVGRYEEQIEAAPWTDEGAGCRTSIAIVEDAAWDYRVAPVDTVAPGTWPAGLVPTYTGNIDRGDSGREYVALGAGRERGVEHQEMAFRWGQEAAFKLKSRAEIRLLLATFAAHLGRWRALTMPWWFRPGADTPETPQATRVRFASDSIELSFSGGACAAVKLAFWQVPWEAEPIEDEEPEQAGTAWLYRHKLDVPGGPLFWRYTDYARPITLVEEGDDVTYFPAKIEHDKLTHGYMLDDDPSKLKGFVADGHPWMLVVARMLQAPLQIDIFRLTPEVEGATPVLRYSGEIADVTGKGRSLSATTTVLGGTLDIKVPNFYIQEDCNHDFCSGGCGLVIDNWTFTVEVTAIDGAVLHAQVISNPPGATLADDFFANGDADKGSGTTYEAVEIVRSVDLGGGEQSLTLARAFTALAVGDTIAIRPNCSGTWAECQRYGNTINYGGHRHVGSDNISVPQPQSQTAGGKK